MFKFIWYSLKSESFDSQNVYMVIMYNFIEW